MKIKSFKLWLNIITFIGLFILVYLSRNQITETFNKLTDLNFFWLTLILPLQALNYFSVAKFYQSYLKGLGEDIKTKKLYSTAIEMNFVNNVFPSGGVSGFGYLRSRLKKLDIPTSKSTLTQLSRHTLTFMGFIIYLFIAMILLSLFGNASRIMVFVSVSLIFTLTIGAVLLVYVISSSSRISKFVAALPKLVNVVVSKLKRNRKPTIDIARIERTFSQFHEEYIYVRQNWKLLKKPFLWTMFMNFTELATIFVVYLAFGSLINPGAIIVAYAVASTAGLISVLPGGVGVYEGMMTAILASAGVPQALALSATLVYRVVTMAIFIPLGFVLYQIALRNND